jgi:predicted GNAT family acetyltransferase
MCAMDITQYHDPEEFLSILKKSTSAYTDEDDFMLGLVNVLIRDPHHFNTTPFLVTVEEHNTLALAAFLTPPWPILLYAEKTPNETLWSLFINYLKTKHISLSGVNAKKDLSDAFARHWCIKNNCSPIMKMQMRFFSLQQVQPIMLCGGHLLKAHTTYKDLLVEWAGRFNKEVLLDENEKYIESHVDFTIRTGNAFLWVDKEPVCMTLRERPYEHGVSIGYVYTPKNHRRKGYATNCVAHVSKQSLDEGFRHCTLFTDAQNPTSNSIYQKIGYRYLCDYTYYNFIQ